MSSNCSTDYGFHFCSGTPKESTEIRKYDSLESFDQKKCHFTEIQKINKVKKSLPLSLFQSTRN